MSRGGRRRGHIKKGLSEEVTSEPAARSTVAASQGDQKQRSRAGEDVDVEEAELWRPVRLPASTWRFWGERQPSGCWKTVQCPHRCADGDKTVSLPSQEWEKRTKC